MNPQDLKQQRSIQFSENVKDHLELVKKPSIDAPQTDPKQSEVNMEGGETIDGEDYGKQRLS